MKTLQENLKLFYLGLENSEPFLYKNKDLTTHALIIGMTGSGKTGLGITLLEEAAIDNIPSIIIDPKGDLTNLALTFPQMRAEDFEPYIDEAEAQNKGLSVREFAEQTANTWREGIEGSYQDLARVELLKNSADFRIYTPKSSAGLGISLLSDFEAPKGLNEEDLNNYVGGIATSVLSLAGISSDNLSSPEFLLISQILSYHFGRGEGVSVVDLIAQIGNPPFDKIGVFDVNTFFPSDKRMALAMKINALIASPSFKLWCEGERLNIAKMLFDENGRARANIFSIAHLNDDERMFFVTLLLGEMIKWMRTTSGTSSLRAVLYMDEIYGFFPPNGNPPSKTPMLTLLKQARAFGLGCVLSTQNPVDLDYKGLSNIGTWFIGRLQTAQDKERVISGLSGIGSNPIDKSVLMEKISNLKKRNFLVKNINEDVLRVIETRFALSYLKGPLSNEQISNLMKDKKAEISSVSGAAQGVKSAGAAKPVVSGEISQLYSYGASLELSPYLYASAKMRFCDKGVDFTQQRSFLLSLSDGDEIDWNEASTREVANLSGQEQAGSLYGALPSFIAGAKNLNAQLKSFKEWLYRNEKLELFSALDLLSKPGESKEEFFVRLGDRANEALEAKTDEIAAKFEKEKARLEDKISRASEKYEKEKGDVLSRGVDAALNIGGAILGAFLGRSRSASNISKAISGAKSAHKILNERSEAKNAENSLSALQEELEVLTQKFEAEVDALKQSLDLKNIKLETKEISPKKTDIYDEKISLLWKS